MSVDQAYSDAMGKLDAARVALQEVAEGDPRAKHLIYEVQGVQSRLVSRYTYWQANHETEVGR